MDPGDRKYDGVRNPVAWVVFMACQFLFIVSDYSDAIMNLHITQKRKGTRRR